MELVCFVAEDNGQANLRRRPVNQPYLILEFAHSIHGHFRRIQVTPRVLKLSLCCAGFLLVIVTGLLTGCIWMSDKVSRYEKLESDFNHLRSRFHDLQQASTQRRVQMDSLESLASEVSVAYGLNQPRSPQSSQPLDFDNSLMPTARESIEEFNFLKSASYSSIFHHYAHQWQSHSQPSAWPVTGTLRSFFGERSDPFSGEGAFHSGIDLSATTGTPVHVTADGVVDRAGWSGGYGNVVIVDHGNGVQTYYAHLSQVLVVPGQDVRLGQVVALSGGTGRATSPHLHYEVRIAGTPVNPYRYLSKVQVAGSSKTTHSDLGL